MGIKDWFGLGDSIAKPIKAVGDLYTTDKARIEAETKFEEVIQKPVLAQVDLNKTFAKSARFFDSSWQPLTGWTAGFCIFLYWVPQLIFANYLWMNICLEQNRVIPFPIYSDDIMQLVYLVFGFSAYHIVKKKVLDG